MADLIDRQAAIDALGKRPALAGKCEWEMAARKQYDADRAAIESVPSAQPEQKIEELLPDGTLHLVTDADLSKVGRVLVSQNGTHYGGLYYADGAKEGQKAKNVYFEESGHCEFKCSLCGATIGVVEGGTLDGAWFRFCPNCGAEMEGWCERPD